MNRSASHGERLCLPVRCLRSRMGGRADRSECAREREILMMCAARCYVTVTLLTEITFPRAAYAPIRSERERRGGVGPFAPPPPLPALAAPFAASPPQIHNQNEFPANARTAAPHLGSDYHTHTTNHLACTSERFESQLSLLKSLVCLFNKYTLTGYSRSIVRLP